jgi:hypothetical protein
MSATRNKVARVFKAERTRYPWSTLVYTHFDFQIRHHAFHFWNYTLFFERCLEKVYSKLINNLNKDKTSATRTVQMSGSQDG